MAGTGLQCLAIVHQRLDGVSSLCACEFLFVCFLSTDNRNCQNLLTEICIQI